MTETTSTALVERGPAPLAVPGGELPEPPTLEGTLRRLEEQSALQTQLAAKRLFWVRLGSVFLGVTMAVVLMAAATLIPRAQASLDTADAVMESLAQLSGQLQEADLPAILENLDQTLTQSRSSLTDVSEAVRSISAIDFASLNNAILDLQKVLRNPLGSLFGRG